MIVKCTSPVASAFVRPLVMFCRQYASAGEDRVHFICVRLHFKKLMSKNPVTLGARAFFLRHRHFQRTQRFKPEVLPSFLSAFHASGCIGMKRIISGIKG